MSDCDRHVYDLISEDCIGYSLTLSIPERSSKASCRLPGRGEEIQEWFPPSAWSSCICAERDDLEIDFVLCKRTLLVFSDGCMMHSRPWPWLVHLSLSNCSAAGLSNAVASSLIEKW